MSRPRHIEHQLILHISRFYKFQCACAACAEDWCTADMLGATTLRDLRRVVCAQCGAAVERGAGRRADVISRYLKL